MKTKICTNKKCLKEKPLTEFSKDKSKRDGYFCWCKVCFILYQKQLHKKFPWKRILNNINQRCNNPNNNFYKNYGKRGIKNYLILENVEYLYKKDKAYSMKKPSIDRKDNDGNYELSNCRFIELSKNVARQDKTKRSRKIFQYDLQGNFIREFKSTMEVERILKIDHSHLSQSCNGKRKTTGGFKWKYKT